MYICLFRFDKINKSKNIKNDYGKPIQNAVSLFTEQY